MADCQNCKGERWVCENHPDVPWDGDPRCCGGAGMPCGACNVTGPDEAPAMPPGSVELWSIHRPSVRLRFEG